MLSYLLSLVVIPHGITDIMLSYETNSYHIMSYFYGFTPLLSIFMNNFIYKILFITSSIIHFRHELSPVIPYYIMINYFVGDVDYDDSLYYMIIYLSLLHVPYHYYQIFTTTGYIYEHLIIILLFTGISYKVSPLLIDWINIHRGQDKLSKFLGAIIMSHIYFNEYHYLIHT